MNDCTIYCDGDTGEHGADAADAVSFVTDEELPELLKLNVRLMNEPLVAEDGSLHGTIIVNETDARRLFAWLGVWLHK